MSPDYLTFDGLRWVRIGIYVTIFDNADTKKERAAFAYNHRFGFVPIFAHLGGGWMVGAQLSTGSAHSMSEGTDAFFLQNV